MLDAVFQAVVDVVDVSFVCTSVVTLADGSRVSIIIIIIIIFLK